MQPINFVGVNKVLSKPRSMTDGQCGSLPVYSNGQMCVSCWELNDQEIEAVVKTRILYIGVFSGQTQPPILVTPFKDLLIP